MHANGEARACVYLCQIQREVVRAPSGNNHLVKMEIPSSPMKGQLSSISDKLGSLTSENGFHVEDTEPTVNGLDITPACIIGFAIRRMLDDEVRFMPLVKPQERRDGIDATNRYILGAGEACRSTGMPVHSGNGTILWPNRNSRLKVM